MNKSLIGGMLAALALAAPGVAFAQATPAAAMVIVDRNRIANECNACKTALTQLQGYITQLQQRSQQLNQQLQPELQSIQQADANAQKMPAGAARTTAETQVRTRAQAYQTKAESAQQELGRMDQNIQSIRAHIMDQISDRLDPIIVEVMRARSASIAVDKSVTIAHSPALDVTNDVLARFNTAVPSLSVTPLPQQPAPATPPGR